MIPKPPSSLLRHYILDENNNAIPVDFNEYLAWTVRAAQAGQATVGKQVAEDFVGDYHISTVFLAINHTWGGKGPPILWETMIFGGEYKNGEEYQERYSSHADALEGHGRAIRLARAMLDVKNTLPAASEVGQLEDAPTLQLTDGSK